MRLRSDESVSLRQSNFCTLPGINQQNGDTPEEGSDTSAFRAALRGLTATQDADPADEKTEQVSLSDLAPHESVSTAGSKRRLFRRKVVMVVALLVLLSIAAGMVGASLGGVGTSQVVATPTPLKATDARVNSVPVATPTPTATPTPKPAPTRPPAPAGPPPPTYTTNGPYSNSTPPPGYPAFAVTEPSPDPYGSFGQCTWWAQDKRPDENFANMGLAKDWVNAARARGMTVTQTPAANGTVVFAPGVQGASSAGHVSHVEKILTGGWVLVSEMNFSWNGGGFGRVNYRYIHVGAGVWFIH